MTTRRALCTARTQTVRALTSMSGSISLATHFVPDEHVMGGVSCSPASLQPSVTKPRRRYVERSGDGGCTYGAGHPLQQSHKRCNMIVRGWVNYYGRFYPTMLAKSLRSIDKYLVRWAMRKYKRLKGRRMRAWAFLDGVFARQPELFAHWRGSYEPTTGRWEPYERRRSRTVLREPEGEIPSGHSPNERASHPWPLNQRT